MGTGKNDKAKNPEILSGIAWTFCRKKKYKSKDKFDNAVRQYQVDIKGKDVWQPGEIVFDKPEIKILLERDWEYPPDDKIEFTLESENSKKFSALDLMFQLNNFLTGYDLGDDCFFEGLRYESESRRYILKLGS